MLDLIGFEKALFEKLKDSGLIERYSVFQFESTIDIELINKLFRSPFVIEFDEEGVYYYDNDNVKCYCPDMKTTISEKGEWLSDKLPPITFDISQDGNTRRAQEIESIYCCITTALILKDDSFKNEILDIGRKYDFKSLKPIGDDFKTFSALLDEWLSLQSNIVNIIVSSCRYKISDYKKDAEKYLKDGIQDSDVIELRALESNIRAINFEYSEGVLSPVSVKKLNKIQRLEFINERDTKISSLIQSSRAGMLYRLLNLSTEYISPIKKKKIQLWVQKEVDSYLDGVEDLNVKSERSQLIAKYTRRALRFEKTSVRKLAIES